MIARHDAQTMDRNDLWTRLAAPVDPVAISWRQDGRAIQRDGRFIARWVCYIEANTVRERLDAVVPGEWDLTLELLPTVPGASSDDGNQVSFKARLQVLGVIREDVGTGKDYKQASTDAFKRAAVRFGIGHELYSYEQNWVEMDGDGKFARPVEDPAVAYARKLARAAKGESTVRSDVEVSVERVTVERPVAAANSELAAILPDIPACPKCGGKMWDNRLSKRNPKAPDYKCRDRSCDGVLWPARGVPSATEGLAATPSKSSALVTDEIPF